MITAINAYCMKYYLHSLTSKLSICVAFPPHFQHIVESIFSPKWKRCIRKIANYGIDILMNTLYSFIWHPYSLSLRDCFHCSVIAACETVTWKLTFFREHFEIRLKDLFWSIQILFHLSNPKSAIFLSLIPFLRIREWLINFNIFVLQTCNFAA